MGPTSKREYTHVVYHRYVKASHAVKHRIFDEFRTAKGYNRKDTIQVLNGPQTASVLAAIWE